MISSVAPASWNGAQGSSQQLACLQALETQKAWMCLPFKGMCLLQGQVGFSHSIAILSVILINKYLLTVEDFAWRNDKESFLLIIEFLLTINIISGFFGNLFLKSHLNYSCCILHVYQVPIASREKGSMPAPKWWE